MTGFATDKLPLRVMAGLLAASVALIGVSVWQIAGGLKQIEEVSQLQQDLNGFGNGALYQHEAMTTAAQMFTLNGKQIWMERYLAARTLLNRNLIDIRLATPKVFAELNSDLEASSDRLGEIESASYLLMQHDYRLEGLDLLAGVEYLTAKDRFRDNLLTLQTALTKLSDQQEANLRRNLTWHALTLGVIMVGLLGMWLVGLRLMLRWQQRATLETRRGDAAESELAGQKQVLDSIIDNLPVGLFVKDAADGFRYTICNRKAEELFDISAKQMLRRTDFELFPEPEARFFRETDETVMAGGQVVEIECEDVTGPKGQWLAHTVKVPVYDETGAPRLLVGIFEDITVKKQQADSRLQAQAEELEMKNRELEEAKLQAIAAHDARAVMMTALGMEIYGPLNTIVAAADELLRGASVVQAEQVRVIRQAAGKSLYALNEQGLGGHGHGEEVTPAEAHPKA